MKKNTATDAAISSNVSAGEVSEGLTSRMGIIGLDCTGAAEMWRTIPGRVGLHGHNDLVRSSTVLDRGRQRQEC